MQEATITPTTLNGRAVWIARAIWMALFLLILSILAANVPHLLNDTRYQWQVTEALLAARSIFPSTTAFVSYVVVLKVAAGLVFAGTALFLAWRKSDDWMVLFTSAVLLLMGYQFGIGLNEETIRFPSTLEQTFPAIRMVVPTLVIAGFIGLFFLFPTGHFYPKWNLGVAAIAIGMSVLFFFGILDKIAGAFPELSKSSSGDLGWSVFGYTMIGTIMLALISRFLYFRRKADATQRLQIKYVLFGFGLFVSGILFQPLLEILNLFSNSWRHLLSLHFGIIIPIVLPLTIGISALRYRLWDIDIIVRRTLVYGLLTAILVVIYFGSVVILQTLFSTVSGQQSPLILVLSTLAIAALFQPFRHRVQEFIDRRFYRRKYDSAKTLASFAAAARDQVNLEELTLTLLRVLDESVQPEAVSLWLKKE